MVSEIDGKTSESVYEVNKQRRRLRGDQPAALRRPHSTASPEDAMNHQMYSHAGREQPSAQGKADEVDKLARLLAQTEFSQQQQAAAQTVRIQHQHQQQVAAAAAAQQQQQSQQYHLASMQQQQQQQQALLNPQFAMKFQQELGGMMGGLMGGATQGGSITPHALGGLGQLPFQLVPENIHVMTPGQVAQMHPAQVNAYLQQYQQQQQMGAAAANDSALTAEKYHEEAARKREQFRLAQLQQQPLMMSDGTRFDQLPDKVPHGSSNNQAGSGYDGVEHSDNYTRQSNAKVPSSTVPDATKKSHIFQSKMNATAKEFVPSMEFKPAQNSNPGSFGEASVNQMSSMNIQMNYVDHPAISEINKIVVQLTDNQAKMHTYSERICHLLKESSEDFGLLKEAALVLMEQGIGDAKFRYPGGKLLDYLCENVPTFDDALYDQLVVEFKLCDEYLRERKHARIIETTFFFAEMIRLKRDYRGAVSALLNLVCVIGSDAALRCVSQILKMCGRNLEAQPNEASDPHFPVCNLEKVMDVVRTRSMEHQNRTIRSLLTTVIEFRAKSWGGAQETAAPPVVVDKPVDEGTANPPKSPVELGTVHYRDGQVARIDEDASEGSAASTAEIDPAAYHDFNDEESEFYEQFLKTL